MLINLTCKPILGVFKFYERSICAVFNNGEEIGLINHSNHYGQNLREFRFFLHKEQCAEFCFQVQLTEEEFYKISDAENTDFSKLEKAMNDCINRTFSALANPTLNQ